MKEIMEMISNNWSLIVIGIIFGASAGIYGYNFIQKPKAEQIKSVKKWLLYAVRCAEDEFGPKTGKIKLSFVYDLFMTRFPSVAKYVTFDMFAVYVDEVLQSLDESLSADTEAEIEEEEEVDE